MTGLDFVHSIHLQKVGVHKNTQVDFRKGFNVIAGPNGAGKTTLISSVIGALYENVPERGNIKNMMEKGGYIEVNLTAKGTNYCITKSLDNKRFVSGINDTEYTLVTNFKGAIEPIFGEMDTFTKLVYLDQNNKYDLVTTPDSKRLEVLRNLLDLESFEEKQEMYKKQMKEVASQITNLAALDNEIKTMQDELELMIMPDTLDTENLDAILATWVKDLAEMKRANKLQENNLIAIKQLKEIQEFEEAYDIDELWTKEKRIKTLKDEIGLIEGWENVGCKASPLPCVFLKNKTQALGNLNELKAELDFITDYLKSLNWANFKYLKYTVKPMAVEGAFFSQEEMDSVQLKITELQVMKATLDKDRQLVRAYEALEKRIAQKQALRGSQSLAELEERNLDLRFLADLCGKNGLSLLIIDLVKIELQNILNELIDFSELNVNIELSTNKKDDLDSFQILFGPKGIDISKASGGEIALVRILFKLAMMTYLNRYFGAYHTLILDEPTAALDDDNTDAVINIIKKLCASFNQIIVVSHSNRLINAADYKVIL